MTDSPWLSVVTAVRDDVSGLSRTLESLGSPGDSGVEVLVVDSSADRDSVIEAVAGRAHVHWMEPEGIYPAMNAGLNLARGTYTQFLNAGDTLHGHDVLSRVAQRAASSPAWMFGQVEIISPTGTRAVTPAWDYEGERRRLFSRGFFPQHQGTFVRTQTLREVGGFDLSYAVASDYATFLQLSEIADPEILNFIVADFHEGGASTVHWRVAFREFHRARREVFRPTGTTSIREAVDTATHFAKVWVYREVVEPRRARR